MDKKKNQSEKNILTDSMVEPNDVVLEKISGKKFNLYKDFVNIVD